MQQCALVFLAGEDAASLPAQTVADQLRALERTDAVGAALHGGPAADGLRGPGRPARLRPAEHPELAGPTHCGSPGARPAEYQAIQALARGHQVLHAALAEGWVISKSEALQLAKWTRPIPAEYRGEAEDILVAAARVGVDLRGLAAICAEIRARTAEARPERRRQRPGRWTAPCPWTRRSSGAGVVHGDLTPECTAMVQAVLDALVRPQGRRGTCGPARQRYHDALSEAMKRLLASDLLPQRAGQPVKALVHGSSPAELRERDQDGDPAGHVDRRVPGPVGRPPRRRVGVHRRRRRLAGRRRRPRGRRRRDDHPRRHRRHRPRRGRGSHRPMRPVPPAPHPGPSCRPRRRPRRHRPAGAPATTQDRIGTSGHPRRPRVALPRTGACRPGAPVPAGLDRQMHRDPSRRGHRRGPPTRWRRAGTPGSWARSSRSSPGPGRRRLVPPPPPAQRQTPQLGPPPLDVGQTDDIPVHSAPPRRAAGPDVPVPWRLRPARRASSRTPPRPAPDPTASHTSLTNLQRLSSLEAPPRRPARTGLDPHRPPRRHQPGSRKPRRQEDHPRSHSPPPRPG